MLLVLQLDRDLYYDHVGNPLDTHGGRFPHPEKQGFVVSLSDSPCDFSDLENPKCPPAKHVCGSQVMISQTCDFNDRTLCPFKISCGGVVAKYVRVTLPGKGRILDANIEVHRHRPVVGRGGAVPYGSSVNFSSLLWPAGPGPHKVVPGVYRIS